MLVLGNLDLENMCLGKTFRGEAFPASLLIRYILLRDLYKVHVHAHMYEIVNSQIAPFLSILAERAFLAVTVQPWTCRYMCKIFDHPIKCNTMRYFSHTSFDHISSPPPQKKIALPSY